MLELTNIYHKYKDFKLNDINITVKPDQIVFLLGESGSGKSTILRLIAGLDSVQQGEIIINNRIVASKNIFITPEKRCISLVFQHQSLFSHKKRER